MFEPKIGDPVAVINSILSNSFHLHCVVIAATKADLKTAVGSVYEQMYSFLGDLGYGQVTDHKDENYHFSDFEVNDPRINNQIQLTLPDLDKAVILDQGSRFIAPLPPKD